MPQGSLDPAMAEPDSNEPGINDPGNEDPGSLIEMETAEGLRLRR
jgi:hypothetical protein